MLSPKLPKTELMVVRNNGLGLVDKLQSVMPPSVTKIAIFRGGSWKLGIKTTDLVKQPSWHGNIVGREETGVLPVGVKEFIHDIQYHVAGDRACVFC